MKNNSFLSLYKKYKKHPDEIVLVTTNIAFFIR